MHELANSTLYTLVSMSRKADVVNMVHECEIYEGGSVLELGYVNPKLLRKFFQTIIRQ